VARRYFRLNYGDLHNNVIKLAAAINSSIYISLAWKINVVSTMKVSVLYMCELRNTSSEFFSQICKLLCNKLCKMCKTTSELYKKKTILGHTSNFCINYRYQQN
jgi:hypothetical protein